MCIYKYTHVQIKRLYGSTQSPAKPSLVYNCMLQSQLTRRNESLLIATEAESNPAGLIKK